MGVQVQSPIGLPMGAAVGGGDAIKDVANYVLSLSGRTHDELRAQRGKPKFMTICAACHGPEGKGNGPDSDHAADLTDEFRTDLNPEGVLFYKIWNGKEPMPAFKKILKKRDIWAAVQYAKSLRKR